MGPLIVSPNKNIQVSVATVLLKYGNEQIFELIL
jgi:hypothetical protein